MSPDAAPEPRYEVKFVGHPTQVAPLEGWVRSSSAGFFEPFPPRRVNNVYFDTFGYGAYEENLLGSSARQKLRFRWYGESLQPGRGVLEAKCRRNRLGWKRSFPVESLPLEGVRWSEVRRKLRSQVPAAARLLMDANPFPVLVNSYQRRYFVSADGRVRLTLDRDQRAFDQRMLAYPNLERRAALPDSLVVEFKFALGDRRLASEVIDGIPLRVSRNSKYVIGVQAISGA